MTRVHILLSSYNGIAYLGEQVKSIQEQTFQDFDLFIRDDGSTDGTRDLIDALVQTDHRIHFVDQDDTTNLGVIGSFYRLLNYRPADYYFFCDQDDVWLPDKLAVSLEAARGKDPKIPLMVYTDLKVVDQELKVLAPSMIRSQSHHANTSLVAELTENTVTGGVSMINHALAKLWQTTDQLIMHDWYLALLASSMGELIYLDRPTELYRQHGANVIGANSLGRRLRRIREEGFIRRYYSLIDRSQVQASHLLQLNLPPHHRALVDAYVNLFKYPRHQRYRLLKDYGLKKNRRLHSLVFWLLIMLRNKR